jgi:hypothetical protein
MNAYQTIIQQSLTPTAIRPLIVLLSCLAYLLVTRIAGGVYDPFWLMFAGWLEGNPEACVIGAFFGGVLLLGIFSWLIQRSAATYFIAVVSCLLWVAFCLCMREIVFA